MMKRILLMTMGFLSQIALLKAQDDGMSRHAHCSLEYTTELQTDFKGGANWANLLQAAFEMPLHKQFSFEAKTLSTATTRGESLISDLQGFSNIEAENIPLALAVFGLRFQHNGTEIFAGVHNVNEDYFTTPCASLFTGSSPGISPTLSACLPIANYPLSALGLHWKQQTNHWLFDASIYNGKASSGLSRHNHPFHFRPEKDGIFSMLSANHENQKHSYTFGGFLYHGTMEDEETGTSATPDKHTTVAVWLNLEQQLNHCMHLLAHGSANITALTGRPTPSPTCTHYEALGLVAHAGITESGIILNHAAFDNAREMAAELTCKVTVTQNVYLQTALHLIRTDTENHCVGLLRFGMEL